MRDLKIGTLQWAIGGLCAFIGAIMLVVPHQFRSSSYATLQPHLFWWGVVFLLAGTLLIGVAAFAPRRSLLIVAHLFAGAILLLLAQGFSKTGAWTGTSMYSVLGLSTIAAPFLPRRSGSSPGVEFLAPVMGLATVLTGGTILLLPEQFNTELYANVLPYLDWYGLAFFAGGLVLIVVQLLPVPRAIFWAAHLLITAIFLTWLLPLLPRRAWTGIALYAGLGGTVGLLPWLGPRLARLDPRSLRLRLALILAVVAALPLILGATLVTAQEEQMAREQALLLQQRLAKALAQDVAGYVELHEAAVVTLSRQPGLGTLSQPELIRLLRSFEQSYPDVFVFAVYDAAGNPLERSDALPGLAVADVPLFQRVRESGSPAAAVRTSRSINRPVLSIGAPIWSAQHQFAGMVMAGIETTRLVHVLNALSSEPSERVYLVDAQGQVMVHGDSQLLPQPASAAAQPPVAALLAGGQQPGALSYGWPTNEQLAGYAGVERFGWGVVVERPASAALSGVNRGRDIAFAMLILLTGAALLLGSLAARAVTAPLKLLSQAVDQFDVRTAALPLPHSGVSEVARLARAFGDLRQRLSARTAERDAAEQALREQREWLQVTLSSIGDAVIATDTAGRVTFMNPVAESLTGWPQDEVRACDSSRIVCLLSEQTRQEIANPVARILAENQLLDLQDHLLLRTRDGREVAVDACGAPMRDPDGQALGSVLVLRDMTERRRAAQERLRSEEQLRLITDALPALISYVDREGYYRFNNRAYEDWMGLPRSQITGRHVQAVIGDVHFALVQPYMQQVLAGQVTHFEALIPYERHGNRYVLATFIPHLDEHGSVLGFMTLVNDITGQKRSEMQLREQTETLETINQIGQLLSAELDLQKLVQAVTDAATTLSGAAFGAFFYNLIDHHGERYTLYTLSGTPRAAFEGFPMPRNTTLFGPTFHGEGAVRIDDVLRDPRYGQNPPYQGMPPGHLPVRSYLAVPVVSRSGEVLGGLFFGHPTPGVFTERAEQIIVGLAAQAAIAMDNARLYQEAQRAIQVRDQFFSVAAHELKTPTTSLLGYAQLLERRAVREGGFSERDVRALQSITNQSRRLHRLVLSLLDLARLQTGQLLIEPQPLDLARLAQRVVEELQPTSERHQLRFNGPGEPLMITGDELRLEQVLYNLMQNGVKYSPNGGDVELRVERLPQEICIAVRDQGIGIPRDALARLFTRFYRASNVNPQQISGMGLGLYVVREIVNMHGGRVEVESAEGQGSTFRVFLPLEQEQLEAQPALEHTGDDVAQS